MHAASLQLVYRDALSTRDFRVHSFLRNRNATFTPTYSFYISMLMRIASANDNMSSFLDIK